MSKVIALCSAYYAESFLYNRLRNLSQLLPVPEIDVICKEYSKEHEIAKQFVGRNCFIFTTRDIPTLYAAWNMVIEHATREYLTSANTDDFTYPHGFNLMSRYLDCHPDVDIVYGDCDKREGDSTTYSPWKRGDADLENGFNRVGVMPMWRKSLHERFGLFDESLTVSGDYEFWLRCVRGGAKIAHINQTIGLYWKRKDSLENRNKAIMHKEDARIKA